MAVGSLSRSPARGEIRHEWLQLQSRSSYVRKRTKSSKLRTFSVCERRATALLEPAARRGFQIMQHDSSKSRETVKETNEEKQLTLNSRTFSPALSKSKQTILETMIENLGWSINRNRPAATDDGVHRKFSQSTLQFII